MNKKKLTFIAAVWWVILCASLGLTILLLQHKDSRPSETENRMLAPFPEVSAHSLLSGEFMTGFDAYLSDAFFGRDRVTSLTSRLTGLFSALSQDDLLQAEAEDMEQRLAAEGDIQAGGAADEDSADGEGAGDAAPPDDHSEPESTPEPVVVADAAAPETDDPDPYIPADAPEGDFPLDETYSYLWLRKTDGTNEIIYSYENEKIAVYAETLRMIRDVLPADGQVFVTQVPLAAIGNRWTDQPRTFCGWGSSVETVLERELAGAPRIHVYNTWDILAPHMTGDTPMFYHTDHHWSAEAAYILVSEMLNTQNLPVIRYDEYQYKAIRSNRNDAGQTDTFNVLYPLLPAHSYVVTHQDTLKEISLMNYDSVTYLAFMNNSRQPWRKVVTGANTGRKCLIICDSFGNDFAPYLLPYYDEVHMTDFRYGYYDKSEAGGTMASLCAYHGIDDIYLVFSTANGLRKDNSIKYLRKFFFG